MSNTVLDSALRPDSKVNTLYDNPNNVQHCHQSLHITQNQKLVIVYKTQGWGQVQYLYLVLVLKYIFIST